ncbi:hypothetical protein ACHAXT_006912 [Thalassiosira profunda]
MSSPSQRVSIVDGPAVDAIGQAAVENGNHENENGAGSPDAQNEGSSSPTAIIADEEGVESAVNVTNDAGAGGIDGEEEEEEEGGGEEKSQEDSQEEDAADDESEYSYDYEDEEAGQYSGFLIPTDNLDTSAASLADDNAAEESANDDRKPLARAVSRMSDSASPVPETNPTKEGDRKQKWREPTRAAVNMSLRAEKEKTGGRRRLASDLYKTMMADTQEAGFSLEPSDEDSMEKWCIKLFGFDADSNLAKDLLVCGTDHVQLEMSFPDQYPFEPPFVRVVQPRFKRQTGFVMSGALCMELLTKDGWNPINDIESVIVSIRSLMVVGDGRLQAAADMKKEDYKKALKEALKKKKEGKTAGEDDDGKEAGEAKRKRAPSDDEADKGEEGEAKPKPNKPRAAGGSYSAAEAQSAYDHLSSYHKKEGWDKNGYWSRRG